MLFDTIFGCTFSISLSPVWNNMYNVGFIFGCLNPMFFFSRPPLGLHGSQHLPMQYLKLVSNKNWPPKKLSPNKKPNISLNHKSFYTKETLGAEGWGACGIPAAADQPFEGLSLQTIPETKTAAPVNKSQRCRALMHRGHFVVQASWGLTQQWPNLLTLNEENQRFAAWGSPKEWHFDCEQDVQSEHDYLTNHGTLASK